MGSHPLKALLQKRHVRVVELARELGVKPSTISHKLAGRRGWTAEDAVRVIDFLEARGIRASFRNLFGSQQKAA